MKIKKIFILLIIILSVCLFTKTTYAANEVEVLLEASETNLEVEEEFNIKVSITNNSSEAKINSLVGYLEFDSNIFEIINMDIDEISEEEQEMIELIMEAGGEVFDILSLENNWLIIGMADEEDDKRYIIYAINFSEDEDAGVSQGQTNQIGEIKFNVIKSIEGTLNMKMYEMVANEEITVSDAITSGITISNNQSSLGDEENDDDNDEQIGDNEQIEEDQRIEEDELEINEDLEDEELEENDQAKDELVYAGTEDVIPYIIIAMIGMAISYIGLRKYKQI